mgnify:FL=1
MKHFKIILTAVLLFTFSGLMAQTVELEDVSSPPGDITVDMQFSGFPTDVGSITMEVNYNDDLLTYTGGDISLGGVNMIINDPDPNTLKFTWSDFTGSDINETVSLEFEYLGGFSSDLEFDVSNSEFYTAGVAEITVTYVDGSVSPTATDGDIALAHETALVNGAVSVPLTTNDLGSGELSSINGVDLFIEYDPNKVTFLGVSNDMLGLTVNDNGSQISLSWSGLAGQDLSGALLANLDFTYLGGTAALTFLPGSNLMKAIGDPANVDFSNGSVELDTSPPAEATLTIDKVVTVNDSTGVEVPVLTTALSGAAAINLVIDYDDALLNYTGFSADQLSGWSVSQTSGQVQLTKVDGSGMSLSAGDLVTLNFYYEKDFATVSFASGTFIQKADLSMFQLELIDGYVSTPAIITADPQDQTVVLGDDATFSVSATDAIGYQWQESTDGGTTWSDLANGTGVSGVNTDELTITATAGNDGNQYRVVVQPGDVESNAATLTLADAVITAQPQDQEEAVGDDATFSVTATGATGYQWQESTDGGSSWGNLSGETGTSLVVTASAANDGNQYRVVVQPGGVESNAATLTLADAVITAQPQDQEEAVGDDATFSVTATGATGYQWQESTDGGTSWGNLSGETSTSLVVTASTANDGNQYRVVVQPGNVESNAAELTLSGFVVSGTVYYSGGTYVIPNSTVYLYESDGTTLVAQTTSDANGDYTFSNVNPGSYVVTASSTIDVSNSYDLTDAQFIYFLGSSMVGLEAIASDVNESGAVDLTDAQFVYFSVTTGNKLAQWTAPDWAFDSLNINVSGNLSGQDIYGIASGDANSSFNPITGN